MKTIDETRPRMPDPAADALRAGEYFGNEGQQELQRRSDLLWQIVRDDPRFQSHGRGVALSDATPGNLAEQIAIARLVGACACEDLSVADLPLRRAALEAAGLVTDSYAAWHGGPSALDAARRVVAERRLPPDLTVHAADADTPAQTMAELDAVTRACEVLLPDGAFLRGIRRPAVCLYAQDVEGRVVGTSASVAPFHPHHVRADHAWWGMLATEPDRRGAGIALYLGACAIVEMWDRHGIAEVYTGIRRGNGPSEALCSKLGLAPTGFEILLAIAPEVLGSGRVTK